MSDRRVYVGKLPVDLDSDDVVLEALRLCGDVETWTRARDPRTDAPKRFGFATFRDVVGAVTCARALDGLAVGVGERAVCNPNAATRAAAETREKTLTEAEAAADATAAMRARRGMGKVFRRALTGESASEEGEIDGDGDAAAAGEERKGGGGGGEESGRGGDDGDDYRDTTRREKLEVTTSEAGKSPATTTTVAPRTTGVSGGASSPGRRRRSASREDAAPRFVRGRREYDEASERAERAFREKEKQLDELVRSLARERSRRVEAEEENAKARCEAALRDRAVGEGEGGSDASDDDDYWTPLWKKSERERSKRRRYRDSEKERDERDRVAEEAEKEKEREETAKSTTAAKLTTTAKPTTMIRGFAEPTATLVDVPPPPPTSFGLASKKSTTTSSTTTTKARGGLSAALAAADRPNVFDTDADADADAHRRHRPSSKIDVAALVASVPTSRADVFAHPLDWSVYDAASIDDVARGWISKKLTTLLGESEPALVRFVVDKLGARASPESLVADLEPVLDAETDAFVLGLWRVLIFETKKAAQHAA